MSDRAQRQLPVAALSMAARATIVIAVGAAVALAFLTRLRAERALPASSNAGPLVQFDPSAMGVGIIRTAPLETLLVVPALVAAVAVVALGVFAWRTSGWRRLLLVVAGGAIVASAYGLAMHPGPVWWNAYGPRGGLDMVSAPPTSDGRTVAYVTADPGQPYVLGMNVTNPGALPILILGVVEEDDVPPLRWTAVGYEAIEAAHGGIVGIEAAHPFEPVQLAPNDGLLLFLAGRASNCATGSGPRTGSYVSRDSVEVAYQVLGLTRVAEVELPVIVSEPSRDAPCSP